MAKTKKQTAADKAFIDKITTLNVQTGPKAKGPGCPGCGTEMKPVGVLAGTFHGKEVIGDVYACGPVPPEVLKSLQRPQAKPEPKERRDADEQSLSA